MSKHVKREIDNGLSVLAQSIIDENSLDYINIEEIVFVKYLKDIKSGDVLGRCCLLGDRTQFLSDKKFMIDHFYQKLFKLPSFMSTESGKKAAENRVLFMKDFIEQLNYEVWGKK